MDPQRCQMSPSLLCESILSPHSESQHQPAVTEAEDHLQGLHEQGEEPVRGPLVHVCVPAADSCVRPRGICPLLCFASLTRSQAPTPARPGWAGPVFSVAGWYYGLENPG